MEFNLSEKGKGLSHEVIEFLKNKALQAVDLAPIDFKCDNGCDRPSAFSLIVSGKKLGSFCSACGGNLSVIEVQKVFDALVAETVNPNKEEKKENEKK